MEPFRSKVGILFLAGFSGLVAAQEQCTAFLETGIYNLSVTYEESNYEERFALDICSQSYAGSGSAKQKSMQAGLSYSGFGLSSGSSGSNAQWSEKQNEYCESKDLEIGSTAGFGSLERTVVNRAIQGWETCLELAQEEFIVEASITSNTDVARFSMRDISGNTTKLEAVFINPNQNAFACRASVGGKEISLVGATDQAIGSDGLTVVCRRNYESRIFRNEPYRVAPAATIVLDTSRKPIEVEFEEIIESDGPVKTRMGELEARIAALQSELDASKRDAETTNEGLRNEIAAGDNAVSEYFGQLLLPMKQQLAQTVRIGTGYTFRSPNSGEGIFLFCVPGFCSGDGNKQQPSGWVIDPR